MKKLFTADKRRDVFKIIYRYSKVAVIVICISATITFGTLLTSAEVRKAVGDVIVTWFEKFTEFISPHTSEEFTEREWSPEYLPKGFILCETYELGRIKGFEYNNSSGEWIDFSYAPSDSSISIDNEDIKYNIVVENDIAYHLFESTAEQEHDNMIVWDMDGYRFMIMGNYYINELLKIALSVK